MRTTQGQADRKAEDEGGGGEHLPRDLLAYSSAKGGHQQQRSGPAAVFTALRQRRVAGALRSFAEDEGDGVEKFPKDLLACSSAGEAVSSTPGMPRATAACQRPSSQALRRRRLLEAGAFLLPLVFCAS